MIIKILHSFEVIYACNDEGCCYARNLTTLLLNRHPPAWHNRAYYVCILLNILAKRK
jgi:hypothetical protein